MSPANCPEEEGGSGERGKGEQKTTESTERTRFVLFDHQRKSPNRTIIRKEKEGPKVYEPKEPKREPPKEREESDAPKRQEEPEGRHARNSTPAGTRKIAENET